MLVNIPFLAGSRIDLSISADVQDYNVFTEAGSPTEACTVYLTIDASAIVGSTSAATAALILGSGWHADARIYITNNGKIYGKGGKGGVGEGVNVGTPIPGTNPEDGGTAIDATGLPAANCYFTNNGTVAGGGGGGGYGGAGASPPALGWGGGGGGGGQGSQDTTPASGGAASGNTSNLPGSAGTAGTDTAPGTGGAGGYGGSNDYGGDGGALATAGSYGKANGSNYNAGGAAGKADVGDSNINWLVTGTILGAQT